MVVPMVQDAVGHEAADSATTNETTDDAIDEASSAPMTAWLALCKASLTPAEFLAVKKAAV